MQVYTCWANWFPYMKIDIEAETRGKAKAKFMKIIKDADSHCNWNEIHCINKTTNTTKE